MQTLYEKILEASRPVDERFSFIAKEELLAYHTSFRISSVHPRAASLKEYSYAVGPMESVFSERETLVLIDQSFRSLPWVVHALPNSADVHWLIPSEAETKEKSWLANFIAIGRFKENRIQEVIAVGGGILINAASYIAEQLGCDLAYVPTTVLAMSDGAIGGKVRANVIENSTYRKHAHKTFYEPDRVVLDPRFLDGLPAKQIFVGMGEIIKHGVYQTRPLLDFLAREDFDPIQNRNELLKAILWTVELTSVCLNIDPDETKEGSHVIMRGAHDASDKIEEASHFAIPHGTAVALAIRDELSQLRSPLLPLVDRCFAKFLITEKVF
ncbi:hypothetical protein HYV72_00185 [Candidatus Uhrbacteria bacterium]|nr:hypothetical protein [Candidatus Uhrbacteria bacterium]